MGAYLNLLGYYWKKIAEFLQLRPIVGGLDISDAVVRFAYPDGEIWRVHGIRLAPGTMEKGTIKDRESFIAAMRTLKLRMFPRKRAREMVSAIVTLSSVNVYSQVFSIPVMQGATLEKALELNIQMASPIDFAHAYAGSQIIGRDPTLGRFEVFAAFIERVTVDEIKSALAEAGFLTIVLEPRSLALVRAFREAREGFDPARSYILMHLDNAGIDFIVVRHGELYFDYFNQWRDLADEKGEIPRAEFVASVTRNLRQVLNFYTQHWQEPIAEFVLSAVAFREETEAIVKEVVSFPVRTLEFREADGAGSEWAVAAGAALRGQEPRGKDNETSLLGIGASEEFHRERLLELARFWRLLLPASLGVLLLAFFLADIFLVQTKASLESQALFTLSAAQAAQDTALANQATQFNAEVAWIKAAEQTSISEAAFWDAISAVTAPNNVTIDHLSFQSPGAPISLTGEAVSESDLTNFKNALNANPKFQDVQLPLSSVNLSSAGVSFSMTFTYAP